MNEPALFEEARRKISRHKDKFHPGFVAWLEQNRNLFLGFRQRAVNLYQSGHKRYSARTIVGVMRFHSLAHEIGKRGRYKINNNHVKDMARLYLLLHPEQGEFFELRDKT